METATKTMLKIRPGMTGEGCYADSHGVHGTIRHIGGGGVLVEPTDTKDTDNGEWFWCTLKDFQLDAIQPADETDDEPERTEEPESFYRRIHFSSGDGDAMGKNLPREGIPALARPGMVVDVREGNLGIIREIHEVGCVVEDENGSQQFQFWPEVGIAYVEPDLSATPTGQVVYIKLRPGMKCAGFDGCGQGYGTLNRVLREGVIIERSEGPEGKTGSHQDQFLAEWNEGIEFHPEPSDLIAAPKHMQAGQSTPSNWYTPEPDNPAAIIRRRLFEARELIDSLNAEHGRKARWGTTLMESSDKLGYMLQELQEVADSYDKGGFNGRDFQPRPDQ